MSKIILLGRARYIQKKMVVCNMNQLKIQDLQTQLNHLIDKGGDYSQIYELSVKLDMLIVQYYNEELKQKKGDCRLNY